MSVTLLGAFVLAVSAGIVEVGEQPRLAIGGKPVVGTAAMPSPRVKPGESTAALGEFAAVGIDIFSDVWTMRHPQPERQWWLGEGVYDWKLFDAIAEGMLAASPAGVIFPRIKLEPPQPWIDAHLEEMCVWPAAPGKRPVQEVKPGSKPWRALYRRMLRDMIAHVEASSYADRVIGYHLGAFHCGEWHVYPSPDIEVPKTDADINDPLPPWERIAARRDFYERWTSAIADDLIDCATCVRELTRNRKLIGAFFGYWGMTHQKLMHVLESGKVDFFAAPPEYREKRDPGHPGRSQAFTQATFRLHGTVYYEETDFRTALSEWGEGPNRNFPNRSTAEAVGLMRRSIGKSLAGGWENWWFLLGGNRTFSAPEMMATIRRGVELSRESFETPWRPAEVAVFTSLDEYATSNAGENVNRRTQYFNEGSFGSVCKNDFHFEQLPRSGVPFDSYELADIANPRLPDYRVYVFPNAFTLTEEQRRTIKRRVRRAGKTAVWVYAPGYYRNGCGNAANVSDLTGLEIAEKYPVADGPWTRQFAAKESVRTFDDGSRSVFFALPPKADELREAFRGAGAHVWLETPDTLAAGRGFVMIHAGSDGEKVVQLPAGVDVTEVFGERSPQKGVREIRERLKLGETRLYRVRNKEEKEG